MRILLATCLLGSIALAQDPPQEPPPPAPRAATQPAPLDQLRAAERARLTQALSNLSPLPPRKVDEVIRLSLVDGLLEAESPLHDTAGVHQLELLDLGGVTQFNCVEDNRIGTRRLDFQHSEFETHNAIVTLVQIFTSDDYFQFAYDYTGTASHARVQLIQAPRMAEQPNEVLKLYVEQYDSTGEEILWKYRCSAPTFTDLFHTHRPAMLKYVIAPLQSRKLHRTLLTTPTESAWSVLGEGAPPQIAAQVDALVKKLDSEEFADRQAAAEALSALGPRGAMALRRLDRSILSEEQRQAIETVLAHYPERSEAETTALRDDPLFLIGILYSDEKALWPAAFERLMNWRAMATAVGPTGDEEQVRQLGDAWLRVLIGETPSTQPALQPTTAPGDE